MSEESSFMQHALSLGARGGFKVMPNPQVGCVLVRDGEVIAEGWHDHLGGLHAEQMAIADAESRGVATQGCTAYVTLEPCNHFGRTPPCTEALLWAGVSKVVIGAMDPNPTVRGDGATSLRENGIEVECGVLESECEEQMRPFMQWCRTRRPLVLLKAAIDRNGRIDCSPDEPSVRFSSTESLSLVHDLRAQSMAILVGVNTVIRDDPSLTVRGPDIGPREGPVRVVIDPNRRVPENSRIVTDGEAPTLLIHCMGDGDSTDSGNVERVVLADDDGELSVGRILDMLGDRGIQLLMVEGGADTWRRFLDANKVDVAHLCVSPVELSGEGRAFDESELSDAGLTKNESFDSGGDVVSRWSK
ncbi:MAG: bifunctional diaminohydroxyphosphoribosylaminopyrimidine deaminase/5-amino-6-(5-phosphoribosylamino)uracil reductase RibD [Methanobacteriota archaeon]|nr:MAG: bifunctional diaminohydroxyphosphoribosylaminopyrimidine deaminase/5-amino-6-(5-phosphoribosylamino)uracil reductase RibD [Euryarchaeota archaeon]|tara:strand:+ start:6285 stop:7361 length:1077 start_codon:yes stop_codon:yes gene_type:complete